MKKIYSIIFISILCFVANNNVVYGNNSSSLEEINEIKSDLEYTSNDPMVNIIFSENKAIDNDVNTMGNPTDLTGKRISDSNIIANMSLFPIHDGKNGCGMVAMSILLKYYDELKTINQNKMITNQNWRYDSNRTAGGTPENILKYNENLEKANNLRDEITKLTPKILGGWFGIDNMTLPYQHHEGLTKYFDKHAPNISKNIYYGSSEDVLPDVRAILDNDIPVILTLMNYIVTNNYNIDEPGGKNKAHVVVAHGYRIIDGKVQYLVHTGWRPGSKAETSKWVKATGNILEPFIYGYAYIDITNKYTTTPIAPDEVAITDVKESIYNGKLHIPYSINGKKITSIRNNAFQDISGVTEFTVQPIVSNISRFAFSNTDNAKIRFIDRENIRNIPGVQAFDPYWNPNGNLVYFGNKSLRCQHENHIIIGNIKVCTDCHNRQIVTWQSPSLNSSTGVIKNLNSTVCDVFIRYKPTPTSSYTLESKLISNLMPNETFSIPDNYLVGGEVQVRFKQPGQSSASSWVKVTNPSLVPVIPTFIGNRTIRNDSSMSVIMRIYYIDTSSGSSDGPSAEYILKSGGTNIILMPGDTYRISNHYFDYWYGFSIRFETLDQLYWSEYLAFGYNGGWVTPNNLKDHEMYN